MIALCVMEAARGEVPERRASYSSYFTQSPHNTEDTDTAPLPSQAPVATRPAPREAGADSPAQPGFSVSSDSSQLLIDLPTALELTLSENPDLVSVRQNLPVSAAAIRVARRFPTNLNPTVSAEVAPWVFEPLPGDGVGRLETRVTLSLNQPIELGHRCDLRTSIAEAACRQTR